MLSRSALIIGGSGALGRAAVSVFRQDYNVVSVDLQENKQAH
jgi:NAD(P)-dependent dehydrogenase (short-subunit alcohol dehydrogenase family)